MTNSYEQQKNKLKTINPPLMSHHPSSLLPFKAKLPERAVHVVAPDFLISQPLCNLLQLASILLAAFSSQRCQWPHFAKSKGHFSFLIFLDFSGASQSLLRSFWNTFLLQLFPFPLLPQSRCHGIPGSILLLIYMFSPVDLTKSLALSNISTPATPKPVFLVHISS